MDLTRRDFLSLSLAGIAVQALTVNSFSAQGSIEPVIYELPGAPCFSEWLKENGGVKQLIARYEEGYSKFLTEFGKNPFRSYNVSLGDEFIGNYEVRAQKGGDSLFYKGSLPYQGRIHPAFHADSGHVSFHNKWEQRYFSRNIKGTPFIYQRIPIEESPIAHFAWEIPFPHNLDAFL